MKTIKERAIEKYPITAENMDKALAMRKLYEEIAEEQMAWDLDRFCNTLRDMSFNEWVIDEVIFAMNG